MQHSFLFAVNFHNFIVRRFVGNWASFTKGEEVQLISFYYIRTTGLGRKGLATEAATTNMFEGKGE